MNETTGDCTCHFMPCGKCDCGRDQPFPSAPKSILTPKQSVLSMAQADYARLAKEIASSPSELATTHLRAQQALLRDIIWYYGGKV